jgi:hypothetical protein
MKAYKNAKPTNMDKVEDNNSNTQEDNDVDIDDLDL